MSMEVQTTKPERYNNLDGLRTLAAIGVICMHVKANIGFEISGGGIADYLINTLIAQMASFVQLFFILSGFSMCCGYYEKIKNNELSLNKFYCRRYDKILPFFALLVFMDLFIGVLFDGGIRVDSVYEAFADLTLMFGFLPASDISVIGVGWTLGVIFGFYILFPFFVFLIWNKKRAWISLGLTIGINYLSSVYFLSGDTAIRCNVIRWLCYFITGGLIYLYRDKISRVLNRVTVGTVVVLVGFILVYVIDNPFLGEFGEFAKTLKFTVGFSLMTCGALCTETKIWFNPISKFISKVSLEIYLAHMMVFRVIEKAGLTTIAGENIVSYIIACIGTIGGALIFAVVYQDLEAILRKKVIKKYLGGKSLWQRRS